MNNTMVFKGFLYVKRGRIGTRLEGPDYWLQTSGDEFMLRFHDRTLWEPDFQLEFYNRHIVGVTGELDDLGFINVTSVDPLPNNLIPASLNIEATRSGGVTGFTQKLGPVHEGSLPESTAEQIREIIETVRFFELPRDLGGGEPTPEGYRYRLKVTEGHEMGAVGWHSSIDSSQATDLTRILELLESSGGNWQPVFELCGEWTAQHDFMLGKPPTLHVSGKCCFPTTGWEATLQRHQPQGINPWILILDLVVTHHPLTGAPALTELDVDWTEETASPYSQVDIHVIGAAAQGKLIDVEEVG